MPIDEALARRDFTINAMAWDPDTMELRDPFNGRADLDARILRHASTRFAEDPLRVLRGMELSARFELTVAPETVALCRTLSQEGLSSERLWEEWKKLLLQGRKPSLGLQFLVTAAGSVSIRSSRPLKAAHKIPSGTRKAMSGFTHSTAWTGSLRSEPELSRTTLSSGWAYSATTSANRPRPERNMGTSPHGDMNRKGQARQDVFLND